jgi:hypothetical protein
MMLLTIAADSTHLDAIEMIDSDVNDFFGT